MHTTKVDLHSSLPLTCTRIGTCCHGNQVLLNPWELSQLAQEKGMTPRQFRELYCEFGGIRLRFNGKLGPKGKPACSQYVDGFGCSLHLGRPLACRLFPLARQIQNEEVHYVYQGEHFPCLNGCPEVTNLPLLTVGDYLQEQATDLFETAQDAYLELMQIMADIAFGLLLDTGLAESGDKETLPLWRTMAHELPDELTQRIGAEWMDALMLPEITDCHDPLAFVEKHAELLQEEAQKQFGALQTLPELHTASGTMMGVSLHLSHALGANPAQLMEHWIEVAKANGARE